MNLAQRPRAIWGHLGVADKLFLVALAAYFAAGPVGASGATRLLLLLVAAAMGVAVAVRWLRRIVRQAIWRLRNRLLVAYLFIALVPVLLIAMLAAGCGWVLASQIAIQLVSSELDRRLAVLERSAEMLSRTPTSQRERAWDQVRNLCSDDLPKLSLVVTDGGRVGFPASPDVEPPPAGWDEASGVVVKDGLLYAWSRAIRGTTEVTLMAPLSRQLLVNLVPGLGDVTILEFSERVPGTTTDLPAMSPHRAMSPEEDSAGSMLAPPRNALDFEFKQGTNIPVAIWDKPPAVAGGLLSVHSRLSAVLDIIFSQRIESGQVLILALYLLAVVFLIVELISLVIGVSLTRTITNAFSDLYEGTERVRGGDFAHRIEVKGEDQIAAVSQSFNRMTEDIEQLLAVSKEKERMQAELEIAREVQRQLYPKSVPALARLELKGWCNPARMVSGDYYDYQALYNSRAVIAIGDVAGKGISAALLMAALQSALRTHIRACLEGRTDGERNGGAAMSTSRLVSQLNEQLYADTSPEKYATFLLAIHDDQSGVFTYTNAGHLPPLLLRNGRAEPLHVNGMVVGAFPFAQYDESQLQLLPGDLLVAYTDGITEPENEYGEMFGEQRVIDVILRNAHEPLEKLIGAVMDAVLEWTGSSELQDDMTILVARRR